MKREERLKTFEELQKHKLQTLKSKKHSKYRTVKKRIHENNKEENKKLRNLGKMIKEKQTQATMKRSYSAIIEDKRQREEAKLRRLQMNKGKEKQKNC